MDEDSSLPLINCHRLGHRHSGIVPSGLICALLGDVQDALETQKEGVSNPVQGMWSQRASWRKWY